MSDTTTTEATVTVVEAHEHHGWAYELSYPGRLPDRSPYQYQSAAEARAAGEHALPYWVAVVEGTEPF